MFLYRFQIAKWKRTEPYITREAANERSMRMEYNERMKLSHKSYDDLDWAQRQFRIFPPLVDFHITQIGTIKMKVTFINMIFSLVI